MTPTTKGEATSARMVEAMLDLIQSRGYAGTGLNTVLEQAEAPKGSLYFHFPGGKEELGERAIALAAGKFQTLIAETATVGARPGEVVSQVVSILTDMLAGSDFQLGCPVSVVTLEMGAGSERLRDACAQAFESWIAPVAEYLVAWGVAPDAARALATTVVSTVEGSTILARALRDTGPMTSAAQVLGQLLDGAVRNAQGADQ
jgi:TetR/AcrR family transcriptional repressor of lmrAB and yxaGH operons